MSTVPPIDHLIAALWDAKPDVRAQAIRALSVLGAPAVPALLIALQQDDRNEEAQGFENADLRTAIVQVGEPMFQALVTALHADSRLSRAAAKTLPLFNDNRAVEPLLHAMHDERISLNSRLYVLDALGTFRHPRAFQPLVTALAHPERFFRSQAARALAEYGDSDLIPSITAALADQPENEKRYYGDGLQNIIATLRKRQRERTP